MTVEWIQLVKTRLCLTYCTQAGIFPCRVVANGRVVASGKLKAVSQNNLTMDLKNVVASNASESRMSTCISGLVLPAEPAHVPDAAKALKNSQVVAVPTDTLYGFSCDACSEAAIQEIYNIKGRSATRPLAICVAEVEDIELYGTVKHLPHGLLGALFPGPVTLILPRGDSSLLDKSLNPGLLSIGVRIPDDPFIRSLCRTVGGALALTSANLSSQPSTISIEEFRHLWAHCSFIFDAGLLPAGRAGSTIVDLTMPGSFKIVRDGSALRDTQVALTMFAVLGAGFGGVSVAWHLLQYTSTLAPVCVDLYDEAGVGGGASGASGGLLHPYNPKGKLLWKGTEGWTAALRLLAVAEAARCSSCSMGTSDLDGTLNSASPLAWRRGILRLARQEKHAITFKKNVENQNNRTQIDCLGGAAARSLVPGLALPAGGLALHIPQAINIHPQRYLKALWLACEEFAKQAGTFTSHGTEAVLRREKIASLCDLIGGYEAIVVCFGAQTKLLPELADKLPLSTCRGVVAHLQAPYGSSEHYPSGAPNLLSSTWLAAQGERDVLLGATKDWGSMNTSTSVSDEEGLAALDKLFAETTFYPSMSQWQVRAMQAGLRAMPPRSPLGSIPLAGCIDDLVQSSTSRVLLGAPSRSVHTAGTKWWLLGGLGSRGLIHHGWLGEQLAKAVIFKNESILAKELRQW